MHKFAYGFITTWWGTIATIPAGWHLCDGTNGTPNLDGNLVVGAGGLYAPGDTGGAALHNHDFTGNGHAHDISGGVMLKPGLGFSDVTSPAPITGTTNLTQGLPPFITLTYVMYTGAP